MTDKRLADAELRALHSVIELGPYHGNSNAKQRLQADNSLAAYECGGCRYAD